jgi:23S rRNA pseudouridine1911/1915/1917 synthase
MDVRRRTDASLMVMGGTRRRLARAVHDLLGGSYARAKREVERGHVTLDGDVVTDPGVWVADGQEVVHRPELPRRGPAPRTPPIRILHLDDEVIVVSKPSGLLVHPAADRDRDTVVSRTVAEVARRSGRRRRVWVVHRLDEGTSGVMVLAGSHEAAERLQAQFRAHSVERRYTAIVAGDLREWARLDRDIGRPRPGARRGALAPGKGGRRAVTVVTPLERAGAATLVEAELGTGRTHQVRVHLSYLGHPVLGDGVYGDPRGDPVRLSRLALHAAHLSFVHPTTGERLSFDEPLPRELATAWAGIVRRFGIAAPRVTARTGDRGRRRNGAATPPPRRRNRRRSGDP